MLTSKHLRGFQAEHQRRSRSSLIFLLCSLIAATTSRATARARRPSSNDTSDLERVRTDSRNDLISASRGSCATIGGLATLICGLTEGVPAASPFSPTLKTRTSCRLYSRDTYCRG